MTSVAAPAGWVKIIAVGDAARVARGRPAEFRHLGLAIAHRPTAMSALLEIGKDPDALVLVPTNVGDMSLIDFVDVLRSVAHATVIAGILPGTSKRIVSELFDHGISSTVALPATPSRLAEAVLASHIAPSAEERVLEVGDLALDVARHRVTWRGREVVLAPKSFAVLQYMMSVHPRVVTLNELLREFEGGVAGHAIRIQTTIRRLRVSFSEGAYSVGTSMYLGTPIETVHRVGYRLRP